MKVSIVVPAYNEEKRISKTLNAFSKYFEELRKAKKLDYEILVVINGTTDNTESVVLSHRKKNKRIICMNLKKGGKGYAVTQGFKSALKRKNDFIGYVDADLATSAESFYDLVKGINGYDGTIASRHHPDSKAKFTLTRRITTHGFNLVVRSLMFMPYRDTQCGAKLFTREASKILASNKNIAQWAFDVQILYEIRKKGLKIKEIPTVWQDVAGSKINLLRTPIQMFASVVRLRLVNSPFRFIVDLYNRLPERIKIHHF